MSGPTTAAAVTGVVKKTTESKATAPSRPDPVLTALAAIAAFLIVLALLAWQVRAGNDPALGKVARTAPKRVEVRRIVERTVVIEPPAVPRSGGATPARGSAVAGTESQSANRPLATPPAPSAPVAPAPAPPPVTRAS